MENVKKPGSGMATCALIFGIIALFLAVLPLISGWFLLLFWLPQYILAPLAIIFGVIALVQKADKVKPIVGMGLAVLVYVMPYVFEAVLKAQVGAAMNSIGF